MNKNHNLLCFTDLSAVVFSGQFKTYFFWMLTSTGLSVVSTSDIKFFGLKFG